MRAGRSSPSSSLSTTKSAALRGGLRREHGMIPLVAPDTSRDRPRKTRLGGPYDFMRRVIGSEAGGDLYS